MRCPIGTALEALFWSFYRPLRLFLCRDLSVRSPPIPLKNSAVQRLRLGRRHLLKD